MVATVLIVSNVVWFTAWDCISTMPFVTRLDKKCYSLTFRCKQQATQSALSRNNHINWLLDLFNAISILSMVLIQIMLRVSASMEQRYLRLRAILRSGERNHFHFSLKNSSRGSHTSGFLKKPKHPCFDLSCVRA